MSSTTFRERLRGTRAYLAAQNRAGLGRVRSGFGQSLQITVAAVAAYLFAEHVLGHHGPLFAATSAIVSLGYGTASAHLRRILEVALGCTLGIAIGDLLMTLLGRGAAQAFLVLIVSILLARYLDNGTIFTTQMGLQSVLVVLLPPAQDGVFARSFDAVVGGCFALVIMALSPTDPRTAPRKEMKELTREFSLALRETAAAISDYDSSEAWHALARARRTQPIITRLENSLKIGQEQARMTLTRRGTREQIEEYRRSLEALDNAIRSARSLARRVANVTRTVRLRPRGVAALHAVLTELAESVDLIGLAATADSEDSRAAFRRRARLDLTATAARLDPQQMDVRTFQGESLVMLIRPLTVDLLVATGLGNADASGRLATIRQSLTEAIDVVDPDEDPRED